MDSSYEEQTPEGGVELAGPDPVLLKDPVVDALMRMVTELAAEVWVERERRFALEDILEQQGVLPSGSVEQYEPTTDRRADIKAARDQFVNGVFKELRRMVQAAGHSTSL